MRTQEGFGRETMKGLESDRCAKTVPGLRDLATGEALGQVTGESLEGRPKVDDRQALSLKAKGEAWVSWKENF